MSKEKFSSTLRSGAFVRQQLAQVERAALMESFAGQGLISEVCEVIDDGKEATVYLCRADPSVGVEWLAGKVYRPQRFRAFSAGKAYAGERTKMDARGARAVKNKTRRGRHLAHAEWVAWEFETLCKLHDAGADVPDPLAASDDAILMEYFGDADAAAPQLRNVEIGKSDAKRVFDRLLENVEVLLNNHLVHGDLSAYNVLWWNERAWIIDVPQAIDVRTNRDAQRILARDVRNLERYFLRYGLSAGGFVNRVWRRYVRGELG